MLPYGGYLSGNTIRYFKENDGYYLDLSNETIPPLPVTKTYTDSVLAYFTEQEPLMDPME